MDTIYADVPISFSYVPSTIYKQDIQISPQHPESVIRLEVSTEYILLLFIVQKINIRRRKKPINY